MKKRLLGRGNLDDTMTRSRNQLEQSLALLSFVRVLESRLKRSLCGKLMFYQTSGELIVSNPFHLTTNIL